MLITDAFFDALHVILAQAEPVSGICRDKDDDHVIICVVAANFAIISEYQQNTFETPPLYPIVIVDFVVNQEYIRLEYWNRRGIIIARQNNTANPVLSRGAIQ
ncbi:MAG TPA: hypothetical protein VL197_01470 [Nitrospirota bacterium]|nr:hypothetical protein [Nitrospirota bacterium]